MSAEVSPLRGICLQDEARYKQSREQLQKRLGKADAERAWKEPLPEKTSLFAIMKAWLELDVLEDKKLLQADSLHVLRAELLARYAWLDGDPKAADWAAWHLQQVTAGAEHKRRAEELKPKLGKTNAI